MSGVSSSGTVNFFRRGVNLPADSNSQSQEWGVLSMPFVYERADVVRK